MRTSTEEVRLQNLSDGSYQTIPEVQKSVVDV